MAKKVKQDTSNLFINGDPFKIAIPTNVGLMMIASNNILRCEANRSYCCFYLVGGKKLLVSKSLKFFEDKLLEWNFFRIHKSNLVNLRHINICQKGKNANVILSDNSEIPIAYRKKKELVQRLNYSSGFVEHAKLMAV